MRNQAMRLHLVMYKVLYHIANIFSQHLILVCSDKIIDSLIPVPSHQRFWQQDIFIICFYDRVLHPFHFVEVIWSFEIDIQHLYLDEKFFL